ncbi:MAG TPA: hemerythrin domain-containing protein [Bryobacteraceae bacterium]|nr:hemerythrin domain-containing protein [Bryobacteraceae bacterium]
MPVQIGRIESDFSNPLGLLSDCHRRIEKFLDVLIRLANQDASASLGPAEREALEKSLTYFRNSAPKHTADEEDSLFPRLRKSGNGQAALACLAELEADHEAAARDHDLVDALGRAWLNAGVLNADQRQQMRQALARLLDMYRRHIAIEDRELFPLAASLLPPDQIAEVGREMADRRGVPHK